MTSIMDDQEAQARAEEVITDYGGRVTINAKVIIFYDDAGNYLIHGSSDQPNIADMFKTASSLWNLNPESEAVKCAEVVLSLPKIADQAKVRVYKSEK